MRLDSRNRFLSQDSVTALTMVAAVFSFAGSFAGLPLDEQKPVGPTSNSDSRSNNAHVGWPVPNHDAPFNFPNRHFFLRGFLLESWIQSMKRKRDKSRPPVQGRSAKTPAVVNPARAARRRGLFRFAAILLPLLALGLVELGLRVTGIGHPTEFFRHVRNNGVTTLTDNPWFGWRFFPSTVARAPRPFALAVQKPPNTVRIFVLGESAAMGDPEPSYGFARQLERLLQARYPAQKIEVVNTGITAINSHVIRAIARDCRPREGDFWLVFAGNNEVIGPFGPGSIFGRQAPSLSTVRTTLALKSTRVGQLLAGAFRNKDEPQTWEGLEFFLRWKIARDSPQLEQVNDSFAANLADIVAFGQDARATVLLSTVPVNLSHFPPLASIHRADLTPEQLSAWEKSFVAGTAAQTEGRFAEALIHFESATALDPDFAQLAFERGRCELALKRITTATASFRQARDLDALRFRADTRINDIVRQTAQAKKTLLVDADAEFEQFTDEDLFYDHVHLNFTGNYRAALLFAMELEKRWPGAQTNPSPWLTEAEVAQRLAWTDFDQLRVAQEMRARLRRPPFTAQSNFSARDQHWDATIAALSVPSVGAISNYQSAIAAAPDDWVLHANFGRLLMTAGDFSGAATECATVTRLMPHSAEGWANRGRLARLAGETGRAKEFLQAAIRLQPDSIMVQTELGILAAALGETENARRWFRAVLRRDPGDTEARVNLGLLLAKEGDIVGAIAEYREALRWRTNSVTARVNLADLLATQGQNREALTLFEEAIALDPEDPIARYNLGRLLTAERRTVEAITHFQVALRQRPHLTQRELGAIHFELGNALAGLGRDAEALLEYAEAVRLIPDFADVHLNYGMSLARNLRYEEAVMEFRETLRLRPQDERARRMLDEATRLGRK